MRLLCLVFLGLGLAVAAPATAACRGDCNGDGTIGVDELVSSVSLILGESPLADCPAADLDGNAQVTVDELLAGLNDSLAGCPVAAFDEFSWEPTLTDPRSDRLCAEAADPDRAPNTTFINCRVEGASFAPTTVPAQDEILVLAYNIERGHKIDRQLEAILDSGVIPRPDVLLLGEVDRGCQRTGFRNIARDYAEALGYAYVYATEFVELPNNRGLDGPYDPPICEHGNAIISRFPLGNVRQIRHAQNYSWYKPPTEIDADEPRLGGRVAVAADMKVGDRLIRLYSLHLESMISALRTQTAQAVEITEDARRVPYPVIVGGDLNAPFATLDILQGGRRDGTTQAFLTRGYTDAHAGLPYEERPTRREALPLVLDFIFTRGLQVIDAHVCAPELCQDLSDHLPIWAKIRL